jgi:hypothetical protein
MRTTIAVLVLAAAAACNGQVGTLSVSLTTAPGSTVLDNVQTLRLVITNPHQVTTAERTAGGFTIALDLPASGASASLIVDGLDASGQVVATGKSPGFPVGAINATIVIYMAPPNSIGAAPVGLAPARFGVAAGALNYGVIFAGGVGAAGLASDAVAIYNTYDHSITDGKPLPAPRSSLALGVGAGTAVYLFGGRDDTGVATATFWRFDTGVAPAGAYSDFGDKAGFGRADAIALPIGNDQFLLSGSPAAELSGLDGSVVTRGEVATLPAVGTTLVATDGITTTMFVGAAVGAGGLARFRRGTFDLPDVPGAARLGHAVTTVPGGKIVIAGDNGYPDALRVDAATAAIEVFANTPPIPVSNPAIAATSRHLIIAGGTPLAGGVSPVADVYDATTLAYLVSLPLVVPRTGATAIPLGNDQILIAGGIDAAGSPIETIELFTPESLE